MPRVEAEPVYYTGVRLAVINNDIMATAQCINNTHHSLITVIKQSRILFVNKRGQLRFKFFVIIAIAAHHPRSHRCSKSILRSRLRICPSYFWVISKTKVIIKAPHNHLLTPELHSATNFTFKFRKGKVTMSPFTMLPNRSKMLVQPFENICHV